MLQVDREGAFRAIITEYGLKEMESGAVAVAIKARLTALFQHETGEWQEWDQYEMEAEGDIWIVKKDGGGINQNGAESLMRYAGWDGSLESIANGIWAPTPCQVVVKQDEYKNQKRMKIAFVNDYERIPGGLSNVDANKVQELQTRWGAQLRAIGGNIKRNGVPQAGKPATPPRPPAPAHPAKAAASTPIREGGSDIPF